MSQRIIYWSVLAVMSVASIIFSLSLVPLMIFVNPLLTYFTTLFIGLLFGFVFSFIIMDLENLEKKHHVLLSIFVPVLSAFDIYIVIELSKSIASGFGFNIQVNPIVVSYFMLFSFIIPYLYFGVKHIVVRN